MRKLSIYSLVILAVMLTLTMGAVAQDISEKASNILEKANDTIIQLVADADKDIDKGKDADKVIDKLLDKTQKTADQAIKKLEKMGYTVECQMITVTVGGIEVQIDPLIIIGWEPI